MTEIAIITKHLLDPKVKTGILIIKYNKSSKFAMLLTSTGKKLLERAGGVSHIQAIEKAHEEYRKYQEKTLSQVEKDYLKTIKQLEVKAKK